MYLVYWRRELRLHAGFTSLQTVGLGRSSFLLAECKPAALRNRTNSTLRLGRSLSGSTADAFSILDKVFSLWASCPSFL